eukprot:3994129-Amphidinium_carterae.1
MTKTRKASVANSIFQLLPATESEGHRNNVIFLCLASEPNMKSCFALQLESIRTINHNLEFCLKGNFESKPFVFRFSIPSLHRGNLPQNLLASFAIVD